MRFSFKHLILPLSIMECINNNCINAMENEEEEGNYNDYQYDDDIDDESTGSDSAKSVKLSLRKGITKALEYISGGGNSLLDNDATYKIIDNFDKLLEYNTTEDFEESPEYNNINNILKKTGEFKNLTKYLTKLEKSIDERKICNKIAEEDEIISNEDKNINYNNTIVSTNDIIESNDEIELNKSIINQLRIDLLYYYTSDNNPHLLELYKKLDMPEQITSDDKKFLLSFYKEKHKKQKPSDINISDNEINTLYKPQYITEEDNDLREIILNTINYLQDKASLLNYRSSEFKTIADKIHIFDELLNKDNIVNNITIEQQEDLFTLQDEMTANLEDNFDPKETEAELKNVITNVRSFLHNKIRSREYKDGCNEYYIALIKITECDELIASGNISRNITRRQYEYFKNLQNEINNKLNNKINIDKEEQPQNEQDAVIYRQIDVKIENFCKVLGRLVKKYQENDFTNITGGYKTILNYVRYRMHDNNSD